MKIFYLLSLFVIILFPKLNIAQDWKDIPVPNSINTFNSANYKYEVDYYGNVYAIYSFSNLGSPFLHVDKYNQHSQNWQNIYIESLPQNPDTIKTDNLNGEIVFSFIADQTSTPLIKLYKIVNGNVIPTISKAIPFYQSYSQYDFKQGNNPNEFYWFISDTNNVDKDLAVWNSGTNNFDRFLIPQLNNSGVINLQLQQVGDTLWFSSGVIYADMRLIKTHKSNISFTTFDNSAQGFLSYAGNNVLGDNISLMSNRLDRLTVAGYNSLSSIFEYTFVNGVLTNTTSNGDYYPKPSKLKQISASDKIAAVGNFSPDGSNQYLKVFEKTYSSGIWDVIGSPTKEIFRVNDNNVGNVSLSYSEYANKYVVAYDSAYHYLRNVKIFNTLPDIDSLQIAVEPYICISNVNNLFSDLSIFDFNDDSLAIVSVSSSDQSVLSDANITFQSLNKSSRRQHFKVEGTPYANGLTTLTIKITDGLDTIQFNKDITVSNFDLTSVIDNAICGTGSVTLDAVTPAGDISWHKFSDTTLVSSIAGVSEFITPVLSSTTIYLVTAAVNGCYSPFHQVTATVNPIPSVDAGFDQTYCGNTSIVLSGTGAQTYSWDNGLIDNTPFSINNTTTFTVTGTDINGCQNTDQILVTINPIPTVFAGNDTSICQNQSITLFGTGASSYSWDNGVINGVSFNPSIGVNTYTVIGTDVFGCQATDQINVTVNALPSVNAGNDTSICLNSSITLGGTGAFTYIWDNGISDGIAFTPTFTSTYVLTGTDMNFCSANDTVVVSVNALPSVDAGANLTICENDSIQFNATGANIYSWSNAIPNLAYFTPTAGMHIFYVTGTDANSCVNIDSMQVTVNALPVVFAGNDTSICLNQNITLFGAGANIYTWDNGISDGVSFTPNLGTTSFTLLGTDINGCQASDQINVTVNAIPNVNAGNDTSICENNSITLMGTGAFTYVWDNGVSDGIAFSPSFTSTYVVTGTDMNFCSANDTVIVTVNALPVIDAGVDQTICVGQSIILEAFGANSYTWDNGVVQSILFSPTSTSTYTVTGTDLNGCQNTDLVDVTVNSLPTIDGGADQTICMGQSVVLGANGANSYSWDNGAVQFESFVPSQTTTYVVTGTDLNLCSGTDTVIVTVNSLPIVDAGLDQNFCENNNVILTGTGAQTYLWDNGISDGVAFTPISTGTYTVVGTDINGCQNTDQITLTFIPLPTINTLGTIEICEFEEINISASSNSQFVFWFDQASGGQVISSGLNYYSNEIFTDSTIYVGAIENGCSSVRLPYQITVNSKPSISLTPSNSDCGVNNGSISATISNGTLPYNTYYWSTGEQNVMSVSNLTTGLYYFNVEDSKGCKALAATEIIPNSITVTPNIINPTCFNQNTGSIDITVSGTNEALSYLWNTGYQTSGISNLRAGTYEVTISTQSGCQFASSYTLTQPDAIENEILVTNPSCGNADGQLVINETLGGIPNYSHSWDNGQNGTINSNIEFGAYTLTTTDNVGCISQQTIYLSEQNAPNIIGSIIEASCNGNDGSIDAQLTPQIGDTVTAISWSNGPTTEDISNLNPGNYICIATTQNNCNAIKGWNLNGLRPLKQEICLVSVDSVTTTNLVVWEKVQATGVSYYNIYRESNLIDDYLLIDTVHYSNLSVFNDVVASPNSRSWRYRISAVDACGVESELSTPHKTLHLNTFDLGASGVKITWDQYEGTVFSSYILWRYTNADGWIDIASLATTTLNYTDNSSFTTPGLDYMVEISLDQPCTATIWRAQDFNRSRSNKEKGIFNPGEGTGEFSNNGIYQINTENSMISVYPNPFENEISIDIEGKLPQTIFLTDINGKKLRELNCISDKSNFKLNDIENGVYFLTISDEKSQKVIKIVKN